LNLPSGQKKSARKRNKAPAFPLAHFVSPFGGSLIFPDSIEAENAFRVKAYS
jgi:hypothetical protein